MGIAVWMQERKCVDCGNTYLALQGAKCGRCCSCRSNRRTKVKLEPRREPAFITSVEQLRAYLDRDELDCLICGWIGSGLYRHIPFAHAISTEEYKREFGIPMTCGLIGQNGKRRLAAKASGANAAVLAKARSARRGARVAWPVYYAKEHAKLMLASPNHPSNLEGSVDSVCIDCGATVQVSARIVLAKQCVQRCAGCRADHKRNRKIDKGKDR